MRTSLWMHFTKLSVTNNSSLLPRKQRGLPNTMVKNQQPISVLERPDSADHDELFVDSKNQVDRLLHLLVSDQLTPSNLPTWATNKYLWDFGSSLQPQESIQVQSTSASHRGYITIDRKIRDEKLFPLKRDLKETRRIIPSFKLLDGKVTELRRLFRGFCRRISILCHWRM